MAQVGRIAICKAELSLVIISHYQKSQNGN